MKMHSPVSQYCYESISSIFACISATVKDLANAERILEEDHYGLEKVKERMLEFLAVRNLTSKGESPIICLV